MLEMAEVLDAWGSEQFASKLKNTLLKLGPEGLPLHKGTSLGGYVDSKDLDISVISQTEKNTCIQVKIIAFFTEIQVNCSCGDDPVPINTNCSMLIEIDKATASTCFEMIDV